MNKQVENVLQMALLDKQELKLKREPVDMHALICQAVQNMALLLESRGGTITLEKIWGDDNYFTTRSMDVFIARLRKYLREDPRVEITNIHGNGFRLTVNSEQ